MMKEKAVHWSHLKEQDISDGKYPFEIHLTVLVKYLNGFVDWCNHQGDIKPIVLDLYHDDVTDIQVTTSSVIFGSLDDAIIKMKELVERTEKHGAKVIREKIETVPWHPAITEKNELKGKYFESHLPLFFNSKKELDEFRVKCPFLHISKNTSKPDINGCIKVFMTHRSAPGGTLREHNFELMGFAFLLDSPHRAGKIITEYAVLDSNEELDAKWLGK